MKFKLRNNKYYLILEENILNLDKGMENDIIALDGDNVILLRDGNYVKNYHILNIEDIINDIEYMKENIGIVAPKIITKEYINNWENILSKMLKYHRTININKVLGKYDYDDNWVI